MGIPERVREALPNSGRLNSALIISIDHLSIEIPSASTEFAFSGMTSVRK